MKIGIIFKETAINVGYSCQLINDDMEVLIVDGHTQEQVDKQLRKCMDIIEGNSLTAENNKPYSNQMQTMNVLTFTYVYVFCYICIFIKKINFFSVSFKINDIWWIYYYNFVKFFLASRKIKLKILMTTQFLL